MAIEVHEKHESRRIVVHALAPSAELVYLVSGTNNDAEVIAHVAAASPVLYQVDTLFLPRESIVPSVVPKSHELWEVAVRYAPVQITGDSVYSFDTRGGTQHIQASLSTTRYPSDAPDFRGLIGVSNGQDVDGVDVVIPQAQFSETHVVPNDTVTEAYKGVVIALTGKVNSNPFRGMRAGECLFLGAVGTRRGLGDWEIAYYFAASENANNLSVGGITGIAKKGWEYLWVLYDWFEDESAKRLVRRPVGVYVEKVYRDADFSSLGI